jgi:hypothetical protein
MGHFTHFRDGFTLKKAGKERKTEIVKKDRKRSRSGRIWAKS